MQSIKNTAVSIVLLFLSYGVYQVITKPLPSDQNDFDPIPFSVVDSTPEDEVVAQNLNLPRANEFQNNEFQNSSDNIPPKLLELDLPDSRSFTANEPNLEFQTNTPQQPAAGYPDLNLDNELENDLASSSDSFDNEFSPPSFENRDQNSFAAQQPEPPIQLEQDPAPLNQTISFNVPDNELANVNQFESDSRIIPSTVMGEIAEKPTDLTATQPISAPRPTLANSWQSIEQMVAEENFGDALYELSEFYRDGNYQPQEFNQLTDWLDALAAKVIYSSEHHMHSNPYVIQPGDTIGSLARKWQVPAQLIYNINTNRIPNPNDLPIGAEIKMIEGPFDAVIDSEQGLMTLYLDDFYAGRFEVKTAMPLQAGEARISDKSAQDQIDRPYWIALSNGGSMYASDSVPQRENELGLNLREAEEVFSILSATSQIRILR